MLDFHLSVQPKTEQRLKIILNSIEDEENFSQSIINDQIARLQRSIFLIFLIPIISEKKLNFGNLLKFLSKKKIIKFNRLFLKNWFNRLFYDD